MVTIIAENKIVVLGDFCWGKSVVGRFLDVGFAERGAINKNGTAHNLYSIARQSDNSLYVVSLGLLRGVEDDYFTPLGVAEKVSRFVDQEILTVLDSRQHADALHFKTLHRQAEKSKNKYGKDKRDQNFSE